MNFLSLLLAILFSCQLSAQTERFGSDRKGKWIVEQGTSAQGLIADGSSLFIIGIDAGKFLTNDLALKLKANLLLGDSESTSIGAAAKYYMGGRIPLEIGILYNTQAEQSVLNASLGYAIGLASNIYLEPSFGISTDTGFDQVIYVPKLSFTMLF